MKNKVDLDDENVSYNSKFCKMKNPVMIFGARGIAKAALEIFKSNGVVVYGFLDDDVTRHGKEIDSISILGSTDDQGFLKLIGKKCEAFVALDDNSYRKGVVKMLVEKRKKMPVNAIHSSALISENAHLKHGSFVNSGVIVGPEAKIGNHCILNTGAIIEHDTELGDFVQVGAGSVINAEVKVGKETFIGSGVTIVSGINIGNGARIGAGSVVISDVGEGETIFGNPAKSVS